MLDKLIEDISEIISHKIRQTECQKTCQKKCEKIYQQECQKGNQSMKLKGIECISNNKFYVYPLLT